jgi:hypothetical protein
MAKIFKISLANTFSVLTRQELPNDHDKALNIIPPAIFQSLKKLRNTGQWTKLLPIF